MSPLIPKYFRRRPFLVAIGALASLAATRADAQFRIDPIHDVTASYETWVSIGTGPVPDHGVTRISHGTSAAVNLGTLPADADVDAIADVPGGAYWFSLADWAVLQGGLRVHPGDVVQWNGAAYAKVYDVVTCGGPAGANVDAIDAYPDIFFGGTIFVLSFDTSLTFIAGGNPFRIFDEEFATMTPFGCGLSGPYTLAGTERRLDLDGMSYAPRWGNGILNELYASFDSWATLSAISFGPGDLAQFGLDAQWHAATFSPGFGALPAFELDALDVALAGLFEDSFETGDTTRWSQSAP
jgi:hypothetical protein